MPPARLVLRPIGPDRIEEFVNVSWTLHGDQPGWVPPMREVQLKNLQGKSAISQQASRRLYICESEGRPLGRIAAFLDSRSRGSDGYLTGEVGYFESIDDTHVSSRLFEAAFDWLFEGGADKVRGPMDGSVHLPHRLMTRGFETGAFLFEPRNPPYYPRLFRAWGFEPVYTWRSYEPSIAQLRELIAPLGPVTARIARRLDAEWVDTRDAKTTLARLFPLMHAAWEGHFGFTALSFEAFVETYGGLLSVLGEKNLMVIHDRAGNDVGMGLFYPDYVDDVRALRGDANGWGSWLGKSRPERMVMHSVAVIPRLRRTGASMIVVERAIRQVLEDGYRKFVVALVVEDFRPFFDRVLEPAREYSIYERAIRR